ncbi:MAG: undecaprenyl-diphosphate phosphatase [Clostridia bacterium]|nr:undecaprenyl-diphosphate phosphatase [Clostridia bacterium]
MPIFLALFFLGLIQGLTEFLPVSSSGHLVLFSKIFGVEESLFVSILLHVATLLSICVVFYKDIWKLIRHPFSQETMQIVVATIPTCVIVLVLMPLIKSSFSGTILPLCFLVTAILLLVAQKLSKNKNSEKIDYKTAFFMGIAQGFAVFPGISRSGSTISAGLLSGKDKGEVAKFSFLMSVPIVLLSLLMEVFEIATGALVVDIQILPTLLAFVVASIVGIFAIKLMIKLTTNASLKWFSFYLILISVVTLFVI